MTGRDENGAARYDPGNIFAKILRGELPCHKVMETPHILAFMDLFPRVDGHTLVIPKAASRNLLDIAPPDLAELVEAVRVIARAARTAFDADGVSVQQFSEAAAGQVVFHTHFHILPRVAGIAPGPPQDKMADAQKLQADAQKLCRALDMT